LKLQAVLFDLDNTLLLFEEKTFFMEYNKQLYLYFRDIMSPTIFSQKLIHSTQMLLNNDGTKSNLNFFMDSFVDGSTEAKDKLYQRFQNFYEKEFHRFRPLMQPLAFVREVVLDVEQRGLKKVIATNPMFPENVQMMRLEWAGLAGITFDLITNIENSRYCKPRLDYYRDICNDIGVEPASCLMVGNDPFNDMIATKTGMKTFLTTDSDELSIELSRELAKKIVLEMPDPDFKGSLKMLPEIIDSL